MRKNTAVQRKKAQRRRSLVRALALIALVLMLAYVFVWQRIYSLRLAKEMQQRQARVDVLEERCRALEFEVTKLTSLSRLEKIARESLGLEPLQEQQVTSLEGYLDLHRLATGEQKSGLQAATISGADE
ncbi:MAG: cell division protein FtsL [bacterium]